MRDIVLIVTDDASLYRDLETALRGNDLPVVHCPDANLVVAECLAVEPSVILYDAAMHDDRPSRFTSTLAESLAPDAPPVVVLATPPCSCADAVAVIAKPLVPGELHHALERAGVACERPAPDCDVEAPLESGARRRTNGTESALSPFVLMLNESLAVVATQEVAAHLVETALTQSSLTRVPNDPDAFARFALDSLYDIVQSTLGEDAADAVVGSLRPLLDQAKLSSGVRRSPSPTSPPMSVPRADDRRLAIVVDDDSAMLRTLERGLGVCGFEVITASDGHAALGLCARHEPDVVVVDLHMPAVDGRQLIALMARTFGKHAPPMVVLTGDRRAPAHMEGAAAVLYKPLSMEALARALDRIVGTPSGAARG